MWASWTALSFIMIFTNRYLKGLLWRQRLVIHRVTGLIVLLITLSIGGYTYVYEMDWDFEKNYHSYFAFPTLYLIVFLTVGGAYVKEIMTRSKWDT